jgi:hypothetical protein
MEDHAGSTPYSPYNSDSVLESVFKDYPFKKPLASPTKNNNIEPEEDINEFDRGAIIHIRCKTKEINWDHYGLCNYPNCNTLIHMTAAKNHLNGHIRNNPSYKEKKDKIYFTQLIKPQPSYVTTKIHTDVKVERLN